MSTSMPSLIIVLLALWCVASESRRRHLRTDPEAFGQADFGLNFNPAEARAYVTRGGESDAQPTISSAPSRKYAPSNFYLSEGQDASTRSPYSPPASQPANTYSDSSYLTQASFENNPQTQNSFSSDPQPIYSPVVAYEGSKRSSVNYAQQVAQYVPQSKPYAQPTISSAPSRKYAPSNFYLSEGQDASTGSPYSPPGSQPANTYSHSDSSYLAQASFENNPQPQNSFSSNPVVAYDGAKRSSVNYSQQVAQYVPQSKPYAQPTISSAPSRKYAPSNFYLSEGQDASTGSPYSAPGSQPANTYSDPSYLAQASFENNPQPQNSLSSDPVVAYDGSKGSSVNYAPQVAQYVPRSKPYAQPTASAQTRPSTSLNYAPLVTRFTSPAQKEYVAPIAIVKQTRDDQYDGTFSFGFEGANGIASSANGYVKSISPKEQAQVMQGTYSYTAPDGTPVVTRWFADETGFHAEGDHLPVAPRPYSYN